jgi:hypothetical protein
MQNNGSNIESIFWLNYDFVLLKLFEISNADLASESAFEILKGVNRRKVKDSIQTG